MPVAALQVQIKLCSPPPQRKLCFWPGRRCGRGRGQPGSLQSIMEPRGVYLLFVCLFFLFFFSFPRLSFSSVPPWQLSLQAPSPRRRSSAPTTDAAQKHLCFFGLILFIDSGLDFFFISLLFFYSFLSLFTGQKGFCCCCRRAKRHWSCHGNYLHLRSVIFIYLFIYSPPPLPLPILRPQSAVQ